MRSIHRYLIFVGRTRATLERQRRKKMAASSGSDLEQTSTGHPVLVTTLPYRMLNPLIAYPYTAIDPAGDDRRDEGEERLRLLRPVLRILGRANEGLCNPDGDGSLTSMLTPNKTQQAGVHIALFKADSPWKPRVCLVAPTARLMPPEIADTLDEEQRVKCIPVRGETRVAYPNFPASGLPAAKLTLDFPKDKVGTGGAHVELVRRPSHRLRASVFASNGARVSLEGEVPKQLLDRLFGPPAEDVTAAELYPELQGELPSGVMHSVADFWQRQLRCHVIASVCAPEGATRPLAFEKMVVRHEGAQTKRVVLRCKLHPSSMECACGLWHKPPMHVRKPGERFASSEVDLSLSMCGRALAQDGLCPLHRNATPNVPQLAGICCADTQAHLNCSHFTEQKRRHSGLWNPDLRLDGLDKLHARVLLASALRCATRTEPMLGKRPREDIEQTCERVSQQMRFKLEEVGRLRSEEMRKAALEEGPELKKALPSDVELCKLDMKAHDLLVAGNVRRHVRPTTKEVVLQVQHGKDKKDKKDGNDAPSILCGDDAIVARTHAGLFPPPAGK